MVKLVESDILLEENLTKLDLALKSLQNGDFLSTGGSLLTKHIGIPTDIFSVGKVTAISFRCLHWTFKG